MEKVKQGSLEIRTLGQFLVRRGPVVLSEKAGRSGKLWELFKYLLTQRGVRLPADTAMETLWPDKEYEDARSAFKVQVYRIKKLMGSVSGSGDDLSINFSQGCYRLDAGEGCWIDTNELEEQFNRAVDLFADNPEKAMKAYQRVIELYQGDYLPEITGAWALPARNHYRRIFLKSVLELSDLYCEASLHEDAIRICEQALRASPLEEELHIRYLQALIGAGKMREAQSHYEYITSFYYLEMGVKPSDELKEIYQRITSKQEGIELDLGAIREMMAEREKTEGAFFCPPDHFTLFCRLEKRKLERENRPVFLGLLTITRPNNSLPPAGILAGASARLKQAISGNMRAGDIFTQRNEAQFMVLFPGLSQELSAKVLERIETRFRTETKSPDLVLRCKIQPLLS